MGLNEPVVPDPAVEAEAGERVEQEIAEERAREASIDERIWEQESAAIEQLEAAGSDSTGGTAEPEAPPRGVLARIRSLLGMS